MTVVGVWLINYQSIKFLDHAITRVLHWSLTRRSSVNERPGPEATPCMQREQFKHSNQSFNRATSVNRGGFLYSTLSCMSVKGKHMHCAQFLYIRYNCN